MIVVEGMDNTGKSTLIAKLGEDLHLTQVRHSPKLPWDRTKLVTYLLAVSNLNQNLKGRVILDRWPPISQNVYGSVLRGSDDTWMREYYRGDHLVIWCNPPVGYIVRNWETRKQMEGVREKFQALISAYKSEMEYVGARFPVVTHDYTKDNYETVFNAVKLHLEKR